MEKEIRFDTYKIEEIIPETDVVVGVYGTLKKHGNETSYLLGDCEFLGHGTFNNLKMYSLGGFPCVKEEEGNTSIKMELYKLPGKQLHRLDCYEGVPSLYRRVVAGTIDGLPVYFYVIARPEITEGKQEITEWKFR